MRGMLRWMRWYRLSYANDHDDYASVPCAYIVEWIMMMMVMMIKVGDGIGYCGSEDTKIDGVSWRKVVVVSDAPTLV